MLRKELRSFLKSKTSLLCLICTGSQGINAAPAGTVVEIGDGQIQAPASSPAIGSLFKATVAGHEIFYEASVGLNSLDSTTTRILGTAKAITTTNAHGSTVVGVWEVLSATPSTSALTTLVPISAIPAISSTPSAFTFTTTGVNGQFVVNLAQLFTNSDGSIYTAVLDNGSSITQTTTEPSSKKQGTGSVMASEPTGQISPLLSTLAIFSTSGPSSTTSPLSRSTALSGPNETQKNSVFSSKSAFNFKNLLATTGSGTPVTSGATRITRTFSSHSSSLTQSSPIKGAVLSSPDLASKTKSQEQVASFPLTTAEQRILPGSQASSAFLTATNTARVFRASSTTNGFSGMGSNSTHNGSSLLFGQAVQLPSLTTTYSLFPQGTTGGGELLVGPSSSALAGLLPLALVEGESSTITTIPPGMSVETITTEACRSAGAMVTTTASGSTVTQVVPELCDHGVAFLLFGWARIPQLCHARLGLFGFFLQFICDSRTKLPDGFQLISFPPPDSNPNPPPNPPNVPPQDPQDEDETPTTLPRASATSPRASSMSSAPVPSSRASIISSASGQSSRASSISSAPADPWVEEFAVFLTTSVTLPSTARAVYMTDVPASLNSASMAVFISWFYTEMIDAAGAAQPNATALIHNATYTNLASTSSDRATIISKSSFPLATNSLTVYPTASSTVSPIVSPKFSLTASASPECDYELASVYGYPAGTEDYCFCVGNPSILGAYAPLLTHPAASSGASAITDCSYTTQPAQGWTPSITDILTTAFAPSPTSQTPPVSSPNVFVPAGLLGCHVKVTKLLGTGTDAGNGAIVGCSCPNGKTYCLTSGFTDQAGEDCDPNDCKRT